MSKNKNEHMHDLTKIPIWKALFFLAIPIILTNILQVWYQFIDSFWVWRLPSEDSFAALTLWWNIIFLIISLWSGFSIAWSILVAQYFWAGNREKVNYIAAQSITAIIIVWILLSVFWYFLSPHIIEWMKIEKHLVEETLSFIRISFIALTFNFISFMFQAIVRWVWEVKLPIYIVLFCVFLNFITVPLLTFWYWDIPWIWIVWEWIISWMWVKWTALATLFTQILAASMWIAILFRWNYWIKTKLKDFKPNLEIIKESFKLGFPSSIEMVARSLAFTVITGLVASIWLKYGMQSTAIAAYWAGWNIIQLVIIIWIALSMAMSILIWQNAWAWHTHRIKETAKIWTIISFILMMVMWIIIFIFAPIFVDFFAKWKKEVIEIWTQMLRIASMFFWLIWIQMALSWTLRAVWKTQIPMIITIIWTWGIKIPLAWFLAEKLALWVKWIWWSEPISIVIMTVIILMVINKLKWKHTNIVKEPEIIG
jgi:putative MATE family efflux protein